MGDIQEEIKSLQKQLESSESYDERSQLRKKIRELKKATGQTSTVKKTGQAGYMRPGMTVVGPGKSTPTPSYLIPTTPTKKPITPVESKKPPPTTTTTTTTVTYRRSSQSSESDKGRDTATPPVDKDSPSHSSRGVNGYKHGSEDTHVDSVPEKIADEPSKDSSRLPNLSESNHTKDELITEEPNPENDDVDYGSPEVNGVEEPTSQSPEDNPGDNVLNYQQEDNEEDRELQALVDNVESDIHGKLEEEQYDEQDQSEEPTQSEEFVNEEDPSEELQEPTETSETVADQEETNSSVEQEEKTPPPADVQKPSSNTEEKGELVGDFRSRLRTSGKKEPQTKPSSKKATVEQVDFRNVLKRTESPSSKLFSSSKPSTRTVDSPDYKSVLRKKETDVEEKKPTEKKTISVEEDSSYEQRREARRRQRELNRLAREGKSVPSASTNAGHQERNSSPSPQAGKKEFEPEPSKREPEPAKELSKLESEPVVPPEPEPEPVMTSKPEPEPVNEPPKPEPVKEVKTNGSHTVGEESTDSAITEDSYEARRRARQKAREAKKKASQEAKNKPEEKMSYKQKREEELKKNAQTSSAQQQPQKTAPPPMKRQTSNASKQLLQWAQHKTRFYDNVKVTDFTHSWKNGLALAAIMHSYMPDSVPFDELTAENPRRNFELAFAAAREAGIEDVFEPEDFLSISMPDVKSVMTYLVTIYQHFN